MNPYVFVIAGLNLIFIALAVPFAVQAWRFRRMNAQLSQLGTNVEGRVIAHDKRTYSGGRGGPSSSYYLTYRYEYDGKEYTSKARVKYKHYEELSEGMEVEVRCLPDHPQTACLARYNLLPELIQGDLIYACGLPVMGIIATVLVIFFMSLATTR